MKSLHIPLYLLTFFLIPHIRWVTPVYSARWVYGIPICTLALLSICLPFARTKLHKPWLVTFLAAALIFFVAFCGAFEPGYFVEQSYILCMLILMPIAGLGASQVLAKMSDPVFARRVLTVLALAAILQFAFMVYESINPSVLLLLRPNVEGTEGEWFYSNRYGANRPMYSLTDPMSAGAWAWFSGIALLVLSPLAGAGRRFKGFVIFSGFISLFSVGLTLSRGPWMLVFISLVCILPLAMLSHRWLKSALIAAIVFAVVVPSGYFIVNEINPDFTHSMVELTSVAFSSNEEGNAGRMDRWADGQQLMIDTKVFGAGLSKISFLMGYDDNFENTFLNVIYGAGYIGMAYSLVIILVWVVRTTALGSVVYRSFRDKPQVVLVFAWAVAWFPYLFVFPCLRNIECSFITFSIFGSLIFFRDILPVDKAPGSRVALDYGTGPA